MSSSLNVPHPLSLPSQLILLRTWEGDETAVLLCCTSTPAAHAGRVWNVFLRGYKAEEHLRNNLLLPRRNCCRHKCALSSGSTLPCSKPAAMGFDQ